MKQKKVVKKEKTMLDVSAGYETFIKDKKVKPSAKKAFDKTIKAATKPRGSK